MNPDKLISVEELAGRLKLAAAGITRAAL